MVSNGLKFAKGKNVDIKIKDKTDHVKVVITDKGSGVDPKKKDSLFKIFDDTSTASTCVSESESTSTSGFGLGRQETQVGFQVC